MSSKFEDGESDIIISFISDRIKIVEVEFICLSEGTPVFPSGLKNFKQNPDEILA